MPNIKDVAVLVLLSPILLFICSIIAVNARLMYIKDTPSVIRGHGPHLVIMIHGLGSTPHEFFNLAHLFNETEYTVVLPSDPSNAIRGISSSARHSLIEVMRGVGPFLMNNSTHFRKWSIIGNSLGGITGKLLAVKFMDFIGESVKPENFITLVTPHFGIGGDYSLLGCIRLIISYSLYWTGRDLRNTKLVHLTENDKFKEVVNKFKKRSYYSLSTFDSNVPHWSSTRGVHYEYTEFIKGFNVTSNGIDWTLYTVPISSLLNHGNLCGKHLNNAWITWNKTQVLDSIYHIRHRFE